MAQQFQTRRIKSQRILFKLQLVCWLVDLESGYNTEKRPSQQSLSKLAERFQMRRLKCKSWTDDRLSTDDGRKVMRMGHMAF